MKFTSIVPKLTGKVAILILLLLLPLGESLRAAPRVVIVYADSTRNTLRTVAGLTWGINNDATGAEITEYLLGSKLTKDHEQIAALEPDILVSIGSNATGFVDHYFPDLPVVFAKVLNPLESQFIQSWESPGGHITGASLDIPVLLQMQKFAAIIPNLKTVGVIHTASTKRLVTEAKAAADQLGMLLISFQVESAKELPEALDSLCNSVDGIWTVADEVLTSPQFVRYTLLETLRSGKPIMGFSRSFVESGALFCLEPDYKYVGRQAAEIVLAVIGGADPATIAPTIPDIVYLYLNLKTEKLLKLKVPAELVDIAKETY